MSFVASLFQPFFEFLGDYKWYILIAILLYLVLTIVFQHSRTLITVVFGTIILIFVITHVGDIYVSLNNLMTKVGENSQVASEQYTDYVENNILNDDASTTEKLHRALNYGILGRETLEGEEELPKSSDASLSETVDYVLNSKEVNPDGSTSGSFLDVAKALTTEIVREFKALFGF